MVQTVLCCFYVLLFVFIIRKSNFFKLPGISSDLTVLLFLLKILAGTLFWKLFISYYPVSDATVFFNSSQVLYDTFWKEPVQFFRLFLGYGDHSGLQALQAKMPAWNSKSDVFLINDSRTLIRLNALLRFFSFGHFYVHAVIICFLSFIGLVYLYKLFFPYLSKLYFVLILALFLLPSVLFWSSTVLKEGLVFLGLGVMLYHCQCGLRNQYSSKNMIGLALGAILLLVVKIYVLIALLPALLANFWIACSSHKHIVLKYVVTCCFFLVMLFIAGTISPALNVAAIVKDKQANFINVAKGGILLQHDSCYVYLDYSQKQYLDPLENEYYKLKKGVKYISFRHRITDTTRIDGAADTNAFRMLYAIAPSTSAFTIGKVKPSIIDILRNFPTAFLNTLVIPALFSLNKTFSGLVLIQNVLLLVFLAGGALFFIRKKFPLAITLFCFSFVIILFALIGLTTPVVGALVRFRIPGIPFLIIGFMLMSDEQKVNHLLYRLKPNLFKKDPYFKKHIK